MDYTSFIDFYIPKKYITWIAFNSFAMDVSDNLVPNNINHKQEEDLTTEEKVALEGKPRLGAIPRVQINIRESDEFKVGFCKISLISMNF